MATKLTASEAAVLKRIGEKIQEIMMEKGLRYDDVHIARTSLSRTLRGGNIQLSTLVRIADCLEADVVVHFRLRPHPAPPVQKGG